MILEREGDTHAIRDVILEEVDKFWVVQKVGNRRWEGKRGSLEVFQNPQRVNGNVYSDKLNLPSGSREHAVVLVFGCHEDVIATDGANGPEDECFSICCAGVDRDMP